MTVKELILELQKLEPDFDIRIYGHHYCQNCEHSVTKCPKEIQIMIDQLGSNNPTVLLTGY